MIGKYLSDRNQDDPIGDDVRIDKQLIPAYDILSDLINTREEGISTQ